METLLNYIEKNWGVAQVCAHCSSEATAVCGDCMQYAYCGSACQTNHWHAEHKLQCIGGGAGEKRAREEEEEREPPGLEEINLGNLTGDIWQYISKFLTVKDLKNLNATQRIIQQNIRRMFFARFRFLVVPNHAHFNDIKTSISAVTVNSFAGLKAIAFKRDNHITDVKIVRPFEVRPNAKLVWPDQITRLDLRPSGYLGPLENLPSGLKYLRLTLSYTRQLIDLPRTLEVIDLSNTEYRHPINNFPMENLRELYLSEYFNHPIDVLQNATKLKKLHLGGRFSGSIDTLPVSIEELRIQGGPSFHERNDGNDIGFNRSVDHLKNCTNLRVLELGDVFNSPIDNLPESLEKLVLGDQFWQEFPPLPNLKSLHLRSRNPLEYETMPRNLKILNMSNMQIVGPINGLPPTLEELWLPFDFRQEGNTFPPTLKKVTAPRQARFLLDELPFGAAVKWY